jgi:hypothetical protein
MKYLKELQEFYNEVVDINHAVRMLEERYLPELPVPPALVALYNKNPTKEEFEEYISLSKQFNIDWETYEKSCNGYRQSKATIEETIQKFLSDKAGLSNIAEKSREKVWCLAYSRGKLFGWQQVYEELVELIDLFLD